MASLAQGWAINPCPEFRDQDFFEGKLFFEGKIFFEGNFFLRDHSQTRAEGVLSPGNRPVCQPDTARGPTSREQPCKKKIGVFKAGAASVRARTGSYVAVRLGHGGVGLGTDKNVASQPNSISIELGADHLRDPGREDGRCL